MSRSKHGSEPFNKSRVDHAFTLGSFDETFGTAKLADEKIAALINEFLDLRPGAILRDLGLRKPIFRKTAAYGRFGRDDIEFPWEKTDKAEALKSAAGCKKAP